MADIKPIETVYKGYRFRSRLEARWAVFFDAAGIQYEYEPQGYEVNGIKYLPDFYLPKLDIFVEVKANRDGVEADILRCSKFIYWGSDIKAIVFLGEVPNVEDFDGGMPHFPFLFYRYKRVECGWWFFYDDFTESDDEIFVNGSIGCRDYKPPFVIRYDGMLGKCGNADISVNPVSDRILQCRKPETDVDMLDFLYCHNKKTYDALKKARKARFEHGECG